MHNDIMRGVNEETVSESKFSSFIFLLLCMVKTFNVQKINGKCISTKKENIWMCENIEK